MNLAHAPADFYLGRGPDAKYLGSLPTAGAPEDIDVWGRFQSIADDVYSPEDFEAEVHDLIGTTRNGAPNGSVDWPWRYASSTDTQWAYVFDAGTVYVYRYGVEMAAVRCNYTRPGPAGTREPRRPQSATSAFPVMRACPAPLPLFSK